MDRAGPQKLCTVEDVALKTEPAGADTIDTGAAPTVADRRTAADSLLSAVDIWERIAVAAAAFWRSLSSCCFCSFGFTIVSPPPPPPPPLPLEAGDDVLLFVAESAATASLLKTFEIAERKSVAVCEGRGGTVFIVASLPPPPPSAASTAPD